MSGVFVAFQAGRSEYMPLINSLTTRKASSYRISGLRPEPEKRRPFLDFRASRGLCRIHFT